MDRVVANPWSVLPIKNAKYAKSCAEMHLSDRNIDELDHQFQHFPNIEVLYLNNNKLRRIENLDANFRIKHLFVENNCLVTLQGSLRKFKFLETLLIGRNNLRDLDGILQILSKLTNLERLSKFYSDLQGNPCAEEPYYRLKVVQAIPSLKVFDRHGNFQTEVTISERNKANQLAKRLSETAPDKKKSTPKPKVFGPSIGERDLARGIREINARTEEEKQEEERKASTIKYGWDHFKTQPPPLASRVANSNEHFGITPENRVSEWEKNSIKRLFLAYDKDKSGFLDMEEIRALIEDLRENKAGIGKIPRDDTSTIVDIMHSWDKNRDGKIHWREFRDGMNSWSWRLADQEFLQSSIKKLYQKAKKEEMNGRMANAKDLVMQALRLEGLDTRTKHIINEGGEEEIPNQRTDVFHVFRYQQSDTDSNLPKTIFNSTKPFNLSQQQFRMG